VALLPDPRTQPHVSIQPTEIMLVYNASIGWSRTAAETYAAERGVPADHLFGIELGTDPFTYTSPHVNMPVVIADHVTEAHRRTRTRALLIAPGVPSRCTAPETIVNQAELPGTLGYPAMSTLLSGAPSLRDRLEGGIPVARENGSGRWEWYRRPDPWPGFDSAIWPGTGWWAAGRTADPFDNGPLLGPYQLYAGGSQDVYIRDPAAVAQAGDSNCRCIPAARIGWTSWRAASLPVPENATNWRLPMDSWTAAQSLGAQPAPVLFSLYEVAGSLKNYAALCKLVGDWGYAVQYFYRQDSIPSDVEALCPVAGSVFTKAAYEGGAVVDHPYYLLTGSAPNSDAPQTTPPYQTALQPVSGAWVSSMGASYGHEYALHAWRDGGAGGNTDIIHRTAGEMPNAWRATYHALRGMSGIEIMAEYGRASTELAAGDPLARLFQWDAAGTVPLSPTTPWPSRRSPRRWAPRRLRG
jgi:hypothetical protein